MPQDSTTSPDPNGTPQGSSKRHWWSKDKVQHKATLKNRRDFRRVAKQGKYPTWL